MRFVRSTPTKDDLFKEIREIKLQRNQEEAKLELLQRQREELEENCSAREKDFEEKIKELRQKVKDIEEKGEITNNVLLERQAEIGICAGKIGRLEDEIDSRLSVINILREQRNGYVSLIEGLGAKRRKIEKETYLYVIGAEKTKSKLSKQIEKLSRQVDKLNERVATHRAALKEKVDAPVNYPNFLLRKEHDLRVVEERMRKQWKKRYGKLPFPVGSWNFKKP